MHGYVGVSLVSFFLSKYGDDDHMSKFLEHVHHLLIMMKGRGVGVGSDCPHISMTMSEAHANFTRMIQMLKTHGTFGEYFPDRPVEIIKSGTRMIEIIDKTLSPWLYFSSADVEGVCGKNFRDFLKRSLP
jgi:microsomal dipeptidase-like Zn-dependent dipeptidase